MKRLLEILKDAKNGDNDAKEILYVKFKPTINYYSKKLYYEEAHTDQDKPFTSRKKSIFKIKKRIGGKLLIWTSIYMN
ncbi:hypothetical protein HZF24_16105 [Sedimentibacter hydroxybenzoicus DSM 7310]|uniref:Uncharacterized protein n=1 Tax=Sedimentibacter hydroxybenzoicus DSM 7310 TaxID=1123245 RepID=A0A974BMA1_SEDHY|nr:hypothetical protein [Sedimentibacter hydroxybenzoicus]NYB75672.1 hypothetical protein [Sedimentibacter hydroxybenzoicus DSM 7310]